MKLCAEDLARIAHQTRCELPQVPVMELHRQGRKRTLGPKAQGQSSKGPRPQTARTDPATQRKAGEQSGQIVAIVPAYNEQATLAAVLDPLLKHPRLDRVVVVSDGSVDHTAEIARQQGVETLVLARNRGKAEALACGVAHTTAPILLFLDGDILGLRHEQIDQLIEPVIRGDAGMTVGLRGRGWLIDHAVAHFGPLLSGIRCLRREVFESLPQPLHGFGIETALNWACRQRGLPLKTCVLKGLKHRIKESKQGLRRGLAARLAMFASVFRTYLRLRLQPPT